MNYFQMLTAQRAYMNSVLLSEVNPDAKLIKDADAAFIGVCGNRACYDLEIARGLGINAESMEEVHFLQQAYLNLDSVFLATLHTAPAGEQKELTLKEQQFLSESIARGFISLVHRAVQYGIDLPSCVAVQLRADTDTDKELADK